MNIEQLKQRMAELVAKAQGIRDLAATANRDLTVDEAAELDACLSAFDAADADLKRLEGIAAMEARSSAPAPRQTVSDPINGTGSQAAAPVATPARMTVPRQAADPVARQRYGFQSFGEFCASVKNASVDPRGTDPRLITAASATTYGSEGVGADGGFAVPPEWRAAIMSLVLDDEDLLARTDQNPISGNSMTFPVDETTAYQSSGGIQAYWDGEGSTITQSKPALKELTAKLHRLTALVPMTEELLEDAPAMGAYVQRKAGEKLAFKVSDAIVNGTGAGMPLGIMNAPCLVTVSKISSQVADTLHAKNVVAMMARMPAKSFRNAVWLVNQDLMTQIPQLGFAVTDGTTTNVGAGALYTAPGAMANGSPYGSLWGRPIVPTEACAPIGDLGDIILADLSQYLTVTKAGGVKSDVSIHLFFDTNTTAFRFVLRMNGQPWLSSAIARKSGSNTLSHFVTLEAR